MITLFAVPKAFQGHIGTIQQNALDSWRATFPEAQILLFGDDPGVATAALTIGAEHAPFVAVTRFGTPLLNDVFDQARRAARFPTMGFVNADIILLPDFRAAVTRLATAPFLMIGQSRDVRIESPLVFAESGVAGRLESLWRSGRSRGPFALDYFVFPSGLFADMPPFAVGRARCDNWLVWRALSLGAHVLDASDHVMSLHQVHDHSHVVVSEGGARPRGGIEARENQRLAGWPRYVHLHGVLDATHRLTPDGIRRCQYPRAALLRQLVLRAGLRMSGR